MSTLFIPLGMPEHDQLDIHAALPTHHDEHGRRLAAYPCAIPGISLTDYSTNPQGKGWGPHCTGPFTTITLALSGRRVTVDARLAELAALIMNANERDGYLYDAYTGAYNCRYIGGTTIWSNHAWGLAIDGDWDKNPQRSPLTTDQPVWLRQRWNRYGFAWGGDYTAPTIPDAMHDEFMGGPAHAVAATNLARVELAGAVPVVVPPPPPPPAHPSKFTWALPLGNYYGNIAGPAASHGGYYASEQDEVANIQRWLVYHGCTSVDSTRWATTTWADGKWQGETDTAMGLWHDRFYPGQSYRLRCYHDDYDRLAVS